MTTLALTLVASWGGAQDNAYLGTSEANSLIALYYVDPSAWEVLSNDKKAALLVQATLAIDRAGAYVGDRLYWHQRLEFPRTDASGQRFPWASSSTVVTTFNIYQTQMREAVELATIHQAMHLARLPGGRDLHAERQAVGIRSYSEGTRQLSESYAYEGGRTALGLGLESQRLLAPYRVGRRVVRA